MSGQRRVSARLLDLRVSVSPARSTVVSAAPVEQVVDDVRRQPSPEQALVNFRKNLTIEVCNLQGEVVMAYPSADQGGLA